MIHKKVFFHISGILSWAIIILAFSSCELLNNPKMSGYGSVNYILADKNALVSAVASATNTIEAALKTLDDNNLANAFNALASKGLQVKVLIDSDYSNSGILLGPKVALRTGNPLGDMDENFIIIDRTRVLALSSAFTASNRFLALSLAQEKLVGDFTNEFYQMFRDGRFGTGCDTYQGKVSLIRDHHYRIGNQDIELYFLPQDSVIKEIGLQAVQNRKSLKVFAKQMGDSGIYSYWKDAMDYGASFNLLLSPDSASGLSNLPAFLNNSNAVMTGLPFDMNLQFADAGELNQSLVFTSFNFGDYQYLNHSDGLMIKITGTDASNILDSVNTLIGGLGTSIFPLSQPPAQINAGFTNIVISEVNWDGVTTNGNKDYFACFIELKNMTASYMDISGFKIWITNISQQADPGLFVIPYGTILKPGGFYVVSEVPYAFSYFDSLWPGMYITYTGFAMALLDSGDHVIDSIGRVTGTPFKGGVGASMVRVLNPLGLGTIGASWYAATNTVNLYDTYTNNYATPGSD